MHPKCPFHGGKFISTIILFLALIFIPSPVSAESSVPQQDQTPTAPLGVPGPAAQPRYLSGFGSDNVFTIFYENRNDTAGCANPEAYRIYFNQTVSGPLGLAAAGTPTNICDTHFTVKNWPITIGPTTYAYRGWGAQGNNPNHAFYVSNDLANWTTIYVGAAMFSDPGGVLAGDSILYGFHDIVHINGHYLGFVESAGGRTYIVRSDNGDQNWTIVARVGGAVAGAAPLNLWFSPAITGPIPSGDFILMEIDGETVYAKLMIPGDRSGAYLAINRAAAQAATPALAESAFLDPDNWTWRDGTTGLPGTGNRVLASTLGTGGHDIREAWTVPTSDPRADHVILYTARYASGGSARLGCAAATPQCLVVLPPPEPDPQPAPATGGLPATGFAPGRLTRLEVQPAERAYSDSPLRLEIPRLGVSIPIVGVPLVEGNWDVSWLANQAGWLEGSAFPTWAGNSVLTGHVYDSNGRPGPFDGLYRLRYDDEIRIRAWGQTYTYRVRENRLIQPDDTSVMQHEEYSWLTVLTCQGYDPQNDAYRFRRAVRAVLVSITPDP